MFRRLATNGTAALALTAACITLANAAELTGKVVAVADGDTLTVLVISKKIRVRLVEIYAPEKKQPFGDKSKQSLSNICAGKAARVVTNSKDRYGRPLGRVTCAGVNANAEQVRRGMAWVFARYTKSDSPLFSLQDDARKNRRGLWADKNPVPPWEWRANKKRKATQ